MVETGGKIYLVDAGAPAVDMILRHGGDVNDFAALFTTHVHSDHTAGMIHLLSLMNWYYKNSSGDFFITEQNHTDSTIRWIETSGDGGFDRNRLRLKVPTPGVVFEDENLKVEYIPTKHIPNSYSILITEGDKRVLFGGDFSQWLAKDDVPSAICDDLDLFVCEIAHFTAEQIAPYLAKCRAKTVAFTHVYPLDKYNDIEGMKGRYGFVILTPCDGDVVEI
jgi:ribonuclease Z